MTIDSIRIYRYDIPFVRPFVTSRFTLQNRSGLILEGTTVNGLTGYGEIAPLRGFSRETLEECTSNAIAMARSLRDTELPATPKDLQKWNIEQSDLPPCVVFGFETLFAGLAAQVAGVSLAQWHRVNASKCIALNCVITGDTTDAEIKSKISQGYGTFKLKIGSDSIEEDVRKISELRALIGPPVKLRLDSNCAYEFAMAMDLLQKLQEYNIEYIEEPLRDATLTDLARLRHQSSIPIAIDETLIESHNRAHSERNAGHSNPEFLESFDVAIVKPSLMGSIGGTIGFCERLFHAGKTIVVTSSLDTGIGVAAATHVACALQLSSACGLDTAGLLASQLVEVIETPDSGNLTLPNRPGLGVGLSRTPDTYKFLTEIQVD